MSNTAKPALVSVSSKGEAVRQFGGQPQTSTHGGQAVRNLPFSLDPVIEPISLTGAKGGNAALTSVIAALVTLGFCTDQTS